MAAVLIIAMIGRMPFAMAIRKVKKWTFDLKLCEQGEGGEVGEWYTLFSSKQESLNLIKLISVWIVWYWFQAYFQKFIADANNNSSGTYSHKFPAIKPKL